MSTGGLNLGKGTITGTLGATSNNGNITETAGGLVVTSTSNINAGTGTITLTDTANDFQAAVTLTGGTTQITDANALTLGPLATGNLTAIANADGVSTAGSIWVRARSQARSGPRTTTATSRRRRAGSW